MREGNEQYGDRHWLVTLAVILGFGLFVWPTRYEYLDGPLSDVVLRVDRISSTVQYWE